MYFSADDHVRGADVVDEAGVHLGLDRKFMNCSTSGRFFVPATASHPSRQAGIPSDGDTHTMFLSSAGRPPCRSRSRPRSPRRRLPMSTSRRSRTSRTSPSTSVTRTPAGPADRLRQDGLRAIARNLYLREASTSWRRPLDARSRSTSGKVTSRSTFPTSTSPRHGCSEYKGYFDQLAANEKELNAARRRPARAEAPRFQALSSPPPISRSRLQKGTAL